MKDIILEIRLAIDNKELERLSEDLIKLDLPIETIFEILTLVGKRFVKTEVEEDDFEDSLLNRIMLSNAKLTTSEAEKIITLLTEEMIEEDLKNKSKIVRTYAHERRFNYLDENANYRILTRSKKSIKEEIIDIITNRLEDFEEVIKEDFDKYFYLIKLNI